MQVKTGGFSKITAQKKQRRHLMPASVCAHLISLFQPLNSFPKSASCHIFRRTAQCYIRSLCPLVRQWDYHFFSYYLFYFSFFHHSFTNETGL